MGMLVAGRWTEEERSIERGAFVRQASVYGGALAPGLIEAMAAEPGRFHLVASLSCPWSHRTLIVHRLKGLAGALPLQVAGGKRVQGYRLNDGRPWPIPGANRQAVHVHELYALGDPRYSGRASVPLLWDGATQSIASNESAAIMRAFDAVKCPESGLDFTLVPESLRAKIDALNASLQKDLSNAVYRAGLAQKQEAYDVAVASVFAMLDALEARLAARRHLFGATITESDWRLFPTLVRFDAVYHTHFRCTRRRLLDYPSLWGYARDLYAWPGMAALVDFDAIRAGYYLNDGDHNPHGIVAAAPDSDWKAPHGREALGPAQIALRSGGTREVSPQEFRELQSSHCSH